MSRLNIMLLLALVLSALLLVQTAYEARRLFAEIEKAKAELGRLEAEHARLLAERAAQATNLRVERLARDRLQMVPVTPAVTQYVVEPSRRAASAPLAAATGPGAGDLATRSAPGAAPAPAGGRP